MTPPRLHGPLPLDEGRGPGRRSLDVLRRLGQPRVAPAGQVILSEGRRPLAIYVMEAGAVALAVTGRAGNRIVLGILGPGDVFGEQALIARDDPDEAGEAHPLLPEARALLPSRFLMVPVGEAAGAASDDVETGRWLAAAVARRLDEAHRTLARSLSLRLCDRTLGLLLALARRWGRLCDGGTAIGFPLTQDDLAAMLGASRESVNRAVRGLVRAGAITRSARSYAVGPGRSGLPGRSESPSPRARA